MLRVLSDIYPPHIKPVRDGWYLTLNSYSEWRICEWTDDGWRNVGWFHDKTLPLVLAWQGLAFDPAGADERFSPMRISADGPVSLGVFLPGASCC